MIDLCEKSLNNSRDNLSNAKIWHNIDYKDIIFIPNREKSMNISRYFLIVSILCIGTLNA